MPPKATRFRATIVFLTLNVPPATWKSAAAGLGDVLDDGAIEQGRCGRRRGRRHLPRAVLPLTVQLVSVAVPALMPPPSVPAVLPLTVLLVSVAVTRRRCRHRRCSAELPLTVQLVSVAVPWPGCRRRESPADVAADGAVGQRRRGGKEAAAVGATSCR